MLSDHTDSDYSFRLIICLLRVSLNNTAPLRLVMMDGRVGRLEVSHSSQDQISVTWARNDVHADHKRISTSPPFSLNIDGQPITFWLTCELTKHSIFNIYLYKDNLCVGRAIVSLRVKVDKHVLASVTMVERSWIDLLMFDNFATFQQYSVKSTTSCSIDCSIIWLGSTGEVPNQSLSHPPVSFDNEYMSDIELIVEDKIIPAHKVILAGHSPVISAMFGTPMKESKENRIDVEDVDFSTIATLINIIYTGDTKDLTDVDLALKVLSAAERYQMSVVKSACEHYLRMNLSDNNVLKILVEADKYNAVGLCATIVKYMIAANQTIMSLDDFRKFCLGRQHLPSILITTLMDHMCRIP